MLGTSDPSGLTHAICDNCELCDKENESCELIEDPRSCDCEVKGIELFGLCFFRSFCGFGEGFEDSLTFGNEV